MITRIQPTEIDNFHRIMDEMWGSRSNAMVPPIDVWEKDGVLTVRAALPGVSPEDLKVTLEEGVLTIAGEVKKHEETSTARVYRLETSHGSFARSIRLNGRFDTDAIEASFDNGIVNITVPRHASEQKRVIDIKVASNKVVSSDV